MALVQQTNLAKGTVDPTVDNRVAPGTSLLSYSFSQMTASQKCCAIEMVICTCGLTMCLMPNMPLLGVPDDAILLSPEEQLQAVAYLQGHWKIVPLSEGPGVFSTSYTDVVVEGYQYTLSGGTHTSDGSTYNNSPQVNYFKVYRSADGQTVYLDHMGSRALSFDPYKGEVVILNGLNLRLMWRRDHGGSAAVVVQQPGRSLSDELQSLAQLHAQGALSAEEFERAKAAAIAKSMQ